MFLCYYYKHSNNDNTQPMMKVAMMLMTWYFIRFYLVLPFFLCFDIFNSCHRSPPPPPLHSKSSSLLVSWFLILCMPRVWVWIIIAAEVNASISWLYFVVDFILRSIDKIIVIKVAFLSLSRSLSFFVSLSVFTQIIFVS